MRWRTQLVAIAVWAVCPSALVAAQGDDESSERAREVFAQGERAYDEGRPEEALAHFRRAFELSPRDGIRFNIAVCLEDLGRYGEAAEQYEAAAASDELSDATRERAREAAAAARVHLGTLRVHGAPAGAQVLVDGEPMCGLPCRLDLDPGNYDIVVRSEAGTQASTAADVVGGETQTVVLTPGAPTEPERAPESALVPTEPPASGPPGTERRGAGWLTWTGLALAVAGGAATIGLGLHTEDVAEDYRQMPSQSLRDKGLRARRATNAAIGVAAVGAVAIAIDLIFFVFDEEPSAEHAASPASAFRF